MNGIFHPWVRWDWGVEVFGKFFRRRRRRPPALPSGCLVIIVILRFLTHMRDLDALLVGIDS